MIVHVMRRAQAAQDRRGRGGDRFGGGRGGGGKGRRPRGDDARRSRLRLRPHLRGAGGARSRAPHRASWSTCRATCRPSTPPTSAPRSKPLADPAVDIATLAAVITRSGRTDQSERGEGDTATTVAPGRLRADDLHPRRCHRPRPALPPHRALRLSPRGARALRRAAAVGQRAAREARAIARARRRHAHRRRRGRRACRSASTRRRSWRRRARLLGALTLQDDSASANAVRRQAAIER